jgi:hypothetical protein
MLDGRSGLEAKLKQQGEEKQGKKEAPAAAETASFAVLENFKFL